MSPMVYCFDFCRAPKRAPPSGPSFWEKKPRWLPLQPKHVWYHFVDVLLVEESDSDFYFTIWHHDHPVLRTNIIFQHNRWSLNRSTWYRFVSRRIVYHIVSMICGQNLSLWGKSSSLTLWHLVTHTIGSHIFYKIVSSEYRLMEPSQTSQI